MNEPVYGQIHSETFDLYGNVLMGFISNPESVSKGSKPYYKYYTPLNPYDMYYFTHDLTDDELVLINNSRDNYKIPRLKRTANCGLNQDDEIIFRECLNKADMHRLENEARRKHDVSLEEVIKSIHLTSI